VFFVQNFGAKAKTKLEKRTFVQKMRAFNVDEIDTLCVLFTALLCHKKTLSRLVFCKYNWDKALCDLAAAAAMPFVRKLSLALKKEKYFFL